MNRLEEFITSMVPRSCHKPALNPTPTAEEERLFFLAITGTSQRPPLLLTGQAGRADGFLIAQGVGKGPYHFLEFSKDGKVTCAREYLSQIASLAALYYDHGIPASNLRFEFNYRHSNTQHWPMDVVVLNHPDSQDISLYVEVKRSLKDIESLCTYLAENRVPEFDAKDRGVKEGDNIRKAKYLWSTRVPFLWLVSPENVSDPLSQFFAVNYEPSMKIRLVPVKSGIDSVKAYLR
jgi:hypothetical protein